MTWRIIQGDAIAVMRTLPAGSIDCVVTDPPYGETSLAWDCRVDGWLTEVRRLLSPSGSLWCFGSLRFFMERVADFSAWNLAQDIVWEKHNGSNSAADRFRRVHELAVQFYPPGAIWGSVYKDPQTTPDALKKQVRRKRRPPQWWGNIGEHVYTSEDGGPRKMRSVIYCRSCHGDAIHPTQKPLAILKPLIRYSCPSGGTVLDPFSGSGSTIIAAHHEGRNAIGIEINPEYVKMSKHRIMDDAPLFQRMETT